MMQHGIFFDLARFLLGGSTGISLKKKMVANRVQELTTIFSDFCYVVLNHLKTKLLPKDFRTLY